MVKDDPGQPVVEHTPKFHDITIENLTATGAKRAGVIMGLPESPIRNLILKNVRIAAATGMTIQNAQIVEQEVVITPESGDTMTRGPGVTINGK
jgi:hypothetical protein